MRYNTCKITDLQVFFLFFYKKTLGKDIILKIFKENPRLIAEMQGGEFF